MSLPALDMGRGMGVKGGFDHGVANVLKNPETFHGCSSKPSGSALDAGVRTVVVDGFEVLDVYQEPTDVRIIFQIKSDIANNIFDEFGIFIGFFGDKFFIGPFED